MRSITAMMLAGFTLVLAGCNGADQNRTTSVPPGVQDASALTAPLVTASAPPAPAERGPIPPNANHAAPGTDPELVFKQAPPARALPPLKGGTPQAQALQIRAQIAAARAPDTASADAAKKKVLGEG
ncbi:MAG: hypothetical protein IT518_12785 [Burkholderiales bacterium]|nr:hypothetical protein [Burkholderiales bacterium]